MMESPGPSTTVTKTKGKLNWKDYNKRYRPDWEKLPECEGWLVRALGGDPTKARCRLCRKEVRAHLGDVKKHAKSDIHKHMMKVTKGGKVKVEGLHVGPKYTRMTNTYREEWEDEPECEGWLMRSDYGARCNVCNVELMPKLAELKKHGKVQKHLRAMTALWDKQGMGKEVRDDLKPAFQPWQLPDIKKRDFELKVSLVAGLESGFRGVKELCGVLEERLGPEAFNMTGPQSLALFRLVLLPYFKDYLKRDMKDAPFSLILDDATHLVPPGDISVSIYYFSRAKQKAVSTYLGLIRIDRTDINVLVESINGLIQQWDLYGPNMVSLITDGVAEICKDREALITLLIPTCPNLLHLHSSFSALSNAINTAVKKSLPASVEFLLRESFNWFADGCEKQHKYRDMIEQVGFDLKKSNAVPQPLVKSEVGFDSLVPSLTGMPDEMTGQYKGMQRIPATASQWLSIADYTTGLFLHYDALKIHFERAADDDYCYFAKLLHTEFCNEHNRLYFTILQPFLTEISDLKEHLKNQQQKQQEAENTDEEEATAGLCEQIEAIFLSLASQILEPNVISTKTVEELCRLDLSADSSSLLDMDAINYGPNFSTILEASALDPTDKVSVKKGAASFLRELFTGLQFVLRDALVIMKSAEHFTLPNFFDSPLEQKHLTAPFFDESAENVENIISKYRLMKMLDWKNRKNTLLFWQEVHDFGDSTGNYPLRVVSNGVWKMLCVPLFNEDVSKTLTRANDMRKKLNYLEPALAEDILICKFGLKCLGKETTQFQPPPELIKD